MKKILLGLVSVLVFGCASDSEVEELRRELTELKKELSKKEESKKTEQVADIDNNPYKKVKIGNQVWMAENLNVSHFRNGDPIPHTKTKEEWKRTGAEGKPAWCYYDNDPANGEKYGKLYNWHAVNDTRGLAPEGWHVPSDHKWTALEMFLGMSQADADAKGWRGTDEGHKLKEAGTTHWASPNKGATNSSGFTGLPGGYCNGNGKFDYIGYYSYWWSSTERYTSYAWSRIRGFASGLVGRNTFDKKYGFSVRCIRD